MASRSDKFVDNFLLYVYVPDYFVTSMRTYSDVGLVNKHIRDMLTRNGLQKCSKSKPLLPIQGEKALNLEQVYGRLVSKENDATVYYMQKFKDRVCG